MVLRGGLIEVADELELSAVRGVLRLRVALEGDEGRVRHAQGRDRGAHRAVAFPLREDLKRVSRGGRALPCGVRAPVKARLRASDRSRLSRHPRQPPCSRDQIAYRLARLTDLGPRIKHAIERLRDLLDAHNLEERKGRASRKRPHRKPGFVTGIPADPPVDVAKALTQCLPALRRRGPKDFCELVSTVPPEFVDEPTADDQEPLELLVRDRSPEQGDEHMDLLFGYRIALACVYACQTRDSSYCRVRVCQGVS